MIICNCSMVNYCTLYTVHLIQIDHGVKHSIYNYKITSHFNHDVQIFRLLLLYRLQSVDSVIS